MTSSCQPLVSTSPVLRSVQWLPYLGWFVITVTLKLLIYYDIYKMLSVYLEFHSKV
ncbi:unnamed protein product [Schistosoma rodhaini]|nr:unnamed protein product [Schistosoma rodhaini]